MDGDCSGFCWGADCLLWYKTLSPAMVKMMTPDYHHDDDNLNDSEMFKFECSKENDADSSPPQSQPRPWYTQTPKSLPKQQREQPAKTILGWGLFSILLGWRLPSLVQYFEPCNGKDDDINIMPPKTPDYHDDENLNDSEMFKFERSKENDADSFPPQSQPRPQYTQTPKSLPKQQRENSPPKQYFLK